MRKIIIAILIVINSIRVFSQEFKREELVSTSYANGASDDIKARESIRLLPDFSFKSIPTHFETDPETGATVPVYSKFTARIDENIILNAEYQDIDSHPEYKNPESRNLTSNSIGSLPGSINVSPTGAATYNIPLSIASGTAGMQPQVGIAYNSQSGNGLLGMKWNLTGLSAITRTNSTIYHDTKISGVNLDGNDKLALDGVRLIRNFDGTYSKEIEDFSKISPQGGTIDNPTYFEVYTSDGKKITYGSSEENKASIKAKGKDVILVWCISKIEDVNGNYIEYVYENQGKTNGKYWIKEIKYTGNSKLSISPYNSIKFFYEKRQDVTSGYIAGSKSVQDNILYKVKSYSDGELYREYIFKYINDDFSKLVEIIVKNSSGDQYNSTIVQWSNNKTLLTENISFSNSKNNIYYFGDFNGDGRTDFVRIDNKVSYSSSDKWYLYIADSNGIQFSLLTSGNLPNEFIPKWSYVSDFTGNGVDDWIVVNSASNHYNIDLKVYENSNFNHIDLGRGALKSYDPEFLYGDFNGNGKCDFLIKYKNINTNNYSILEINSISPVNVNSYATGTIDWGEKSYCEIKNVPLDFNGDLKTDLLIIDADGSNFYSLEGTNFNKSFSSSYPTNSNVVLFGDFNGDRKTDLFTFDAYDNWKICYNKGNALEEEINNILEGFNPYIYVNNFYSYDVNSDGKSELLVIGKKDNSSNNTKLYIAERKDNFFELKEYEFDNNINVSAGANNFRDFDGDGFIDLFYSYYSNGYMIKIPSVSVGNVSSIFDGYNNNVTMSYEYLTNSSIYSKVGLSDYPVNNITFPISVVSSVNIEDGTTNGKTLSYTYKNSRIHRQGKGFLGFEEVKTKNNTTGVENINTYSLTSTFMPFLSSSITNLVSDVETKKISEVTNDIVSNVVEGKRFYLRQLSSSQKDFLKGTHITSTNNTFNDYGNILTSTVSNGIDVVSTTNTYINKSEGDFTFISLPKSTEVKSIRTVGDAVEDEITRKTEFSYYDNGSLMEKKVEPGNDKGTIESFQYDDFGNIERKEVKDKVNNLTARYSETEYDSKGRFIKLTRDSKDFETTYNYSKKGELLSVKDPNNRVTTYTYDSWGNNTIVRDHDGLWSETKLVWINSSSYYKLETASNSPWNRTDYDKFGRVIATQSLIHDNVVYTKNEYYPDQKEIRKSKPYLQGEDIEFIVTKYDSYGRKTKITDNNLETSFNYNLDTNSELYSETITFPSDQQKTSTYDKSGKKISSTDEGGIVNYTFNSAGLVRKITSGGAIYNMEYDIFGQRTKLIDPDTDTTETHYNAFGEVIYNKDARNNTISNITYDKLGRKKLETWSDGNTREWEYDTEFKGSLEKVTDKLNGNEISSITYEYDNKFRLESETEKIGDDNYSMYYTYNNFNKLLTTKYPSDIIITNVYDGNGTLTNVNMGSQPVWVLGDVNKYGQITSYTNGDGKMVTTTYDNTDNSLESITSPGVQNLTYSINSETGNLEFRRDITGGKKPYLCEYFKYDDVNRLTDSRVYLDSPISNPQGAYTAAIPNPTPDPLEDSDYLYNAYVDKDYRYNVNGTFNTHSDAGTYHYQANNHRVQKITNATQHYKPVAIEDITYNKFNKVSTITTSGTNKKLELTYGTHNERILSKYFESNILKRTKIYALGTYEETKDEATGTKKKITYILTGSGLTAFYKSENEQSGQLYFLYTDHLGSPYAVTDVTGDVKERYSFTPWGKRRDPEDWTKSLSSSPQYFTRGFTGHEHLDEFGLINMNGRMYDPQIGLFISPDPYVQSSSSQNLNRYGYCLNNPLVLTDPSGYKWKWSYLIPGVGQVQALSDFSGTTNIAMQNKELFMPFLGPMSWSLKNKQKIVDGAALAANPFKYPAMLASGIDFVNNGDLSRMDPFKKGTIINNSNRLYRGLFEADTDRPNWGWQILSRLTWQSLTTSAGLFISNMYNLSGKVNNVEYYKGATVLQINNFGDGRGMCIGGYMYLDSSHDLSLNNPLFIHEYGHFLQSRSWGPLTLFSSVQSLLSTMGMSSVRHQKTWWEMDANARGYSYFHGRMNNNQIRNFQASRYFDRMKYYDGRFWQYMIPFHGYLYYIYNIHKSN